MSQKSVDFLRQLLRRIRSKLLVIGDGAPIHRGQPVKDFLAAGAATRLQREQLPACAPEQNPDEGVRNYLKGVELRNVRCQDPADLRDALRSAATRLRHKRAVLRGCVRQCGYAMQPAATAGIRARLGVVVRRYRRGPALRSASPRSR